MTNIHLHVHMCGVTCAGSCTHGLICIWRFEASIGYISWLLSTLHTEAGFLKKKCSLPFIWCDQLACLTIPLLYLPSSGITGICFVHLAFVWTVGVPAQMLRHAWHTALFLLSHGTRPGSEIFTKQNAMWLFLVYQSNDCYNPYVLYSSCSHLCNEDSPPPVSALPVLCIVRRMGSCCDARFICVLERQ